MKRIKKSPTIPSKLQKFIDKHREENSCPTWKQFRRHDDARNEVQEKLKKDQRGLCAYCEINFSNPTDSTSGDFQVEHYHPKSRDVKYQLDWNNMLGVCLGGAERNVAERYIEKDADDEQVFPYGRHCGAAKDKGDPDDLQILNPLVDIPAFPCLFKIKRGNKGTSFKKGEDITAEDVRNGDFPWNEIRLFVDMNDEHIRSWVSEDIPIRTQILQKAQNSIDRLNLNCHFLARARYRVVENLNKKFESMSKVLGEEEAMKELMYETYDSDGDWIPFFTTVRAEFGEYAEDRLKEIGYDG